MEWFLSVNHKLVYIFKKYERSKIFHKHGLKLLFCLKKELLVVSKE
jgi:hypothetical protein